jgi:hypothetical protein
VKEALAAYNTAILHYTAPPVVGGVEAVIQAQAKNIEYALRVVAALKSRGCHPKLVVTGPPDPHDAQSMAYFEELQRLRKRLDVEEEMCFVFESGPDPDQPFTIDARAVGDLLRSLVLFTPHIHNDGILALSSSL